MKCVSRAVRTAISTAALLSILIPSSRVSAQADGTTIRLQTAAKPGKWISGRSAGISADSVSIIPDTTSDTLRFAKSELHRLDVSVGRKSSAGRGALIGGAVGGALIGSFSHHERWETVKLGPRVSAGLRGRRSVGLTVEF